MSSRESTKTVVAEAVAQAVREAATAAAKAVSDAAVAASSIQSSAISVDITRIKEDIKEIKDDLKEGSRQYVNNTDYAEHLKADADHETRIRVLEQSMWKQVGMSSVISSVIAVGITIAIKLLFK